VIRTRILAHGIGGRLDLPVPVSYFAAGAAVVLIVSFVALAILWPRPRLQDGPRTGRGVAIPVKWASAVGVGGLLLAIVAGVTALLAPAAGARNIAPVLLWVGFWLAFPFLGAVAGNLYAHLNPWRAIARWLGIGNRPRPELVGRLGVWPAAVALLAFTWMELVYPDSAMPATVGVAAVAYTGYLLVLMASFGREQALTAADAFTPYNRLISSLSPWGRTAEGRVYYRGWLRALPVIPEWRGLAAFVVVMIGSVTYDGLSGTGWWSTATGAFGATVAGGTVLLVGVCLLVGAAYYLACLVATRMGKGRRPVGAVAGRFAHTLVPIALAYAVAHYFTLVVFEGQQLISAASDPFGLGWDLFGTRDYKINFFLGPVVVWYVQVGAIVGGHVLGVILAHDRALHDFPGPGAVRSQYAMLVLMVLLTILGLYVLSG
jgi:hypothetical protein